MQKGKTVKLRTLLEDALTIVDDLDDCAITDRDDCVKCGLDILCEAINVLVQCYEEHER